MLKKKKKGAGLFAHIMYTHFTEHMLETYSYYLNNECILVRG